jgi:hypothetical protein
MPYPEAVIKRFWRYVQMCEHGKDCALCCWPWMASRQLPPSLAYGRFCPTRRKSMAAHRLMWQLVHEMPIPQGHFICHRCDIPYCVNPAHLFLGTHHDNMEDRQNKGRTKAPQGEQSGHAKLSEADVYAIRGALKTLAEQYGVTTANIQAILTRRTWKHLPENVA